MKKLFILLLLLSNLLGYSQDTLTSLGITKKIDSLIKHKQFFEARKLFLSEKDNLIEYDQLIIGVSLDDVFNKPEQAIKKANLLFETYKTTLDDQTKYSLLNIKQINYSRIYEYNKAYEAANDIIKNYSHLMKKDELKGLKNTNLIWKALKDEEKQSIVINDETTIKMIRDTAGLMNLVAESNGEKINFIFDTGANISTVTKSTAEKFKMKILKGKIDVGAITGKIVQAEMAICPEFKVGNITIKNAVFLVFPDKALTIKQINYTIHGIIGFPIIEAMNEIQITLKGEFIIPANKTDRALNNLALDFLTPVIELNNEAYTFDSGADQTMLYLPYFNKYKETITKDSKEVNYRFGGAGGSVTKKGYYTIFKTVLEKKEIQLENVIAISEEIKDSENLYFGNIGQDIIRQFDKMILNFEFMYIGFEE